MEEIDQLLFNASISVFAVTRNKERWQGEDCLDNAQFYQSDDDAFVVKEKEVVQRKLVFYFSPFNTDADEMQKERKQIMATPPYVVLMCQRILVTAPSKALVTKLVPIMTKTYDGNGDYTQRNIGGGLIEIWSHSETVF